MNQLVNQKEGVKLYSQDAISIATFFGGLLAVGILIRRNFINLGKEKSGNNALIISIVTTILLLPAKHFLNNRCNFKSFFMRSN